MGRMMIGRALATALVAVTTAGLLGASPASAAPPGNEPLEILPGNLVSNVTNQWGGQRANGLYGITLGSSRTLVDETGALGTFTTSDNTFIVVSSGGGTSATATQTVDLTAATAAIDSGLVVADLSAYLGATTTSNSPTIEMSFEFRDASSAVLDSVTFGPIGDAERGNATGFVHRTSEPSVPVGTRAVLVSATTRATGTAYFDEVSLTLSAPVPNANDDSPTTVVDQPVTFNPVDNDTATGPAAIVPESVRLLDGAGDPVTTLTTVDGAYTVDTSTGEVTYTPNPGFIGTGEPVSYQVTDSNGQSSTSSITVVVGDVVGVSMINGPVALSSILLVLFISGGAVFLRRRPTSQRV